VLQALLVQHGCAADVDHRQGLAVLLLLLLLLATAASSNCRAGNQLGK
jgi:hypothetical protein